MEALGIYAHPFIFRRWEGALTILVVGDKFQSSKHWLLVLPNQEPLQGPAPITPVRPNIYAYKYSGWPTVNHSLMLILRLGGTPNWLEIYLLQLQSADDPWGKVR